MIIGAGLSAADAILNAQVKNPIFCSSATLTL